MTSAAEGLAAPTLLEVVGLTKTFGGVTRVDHIQLTVRQGDIYGFLGPNGAGKSTTIRMMLGLVRPTSGLVRISGRAPTLRQRADIGAIIEAPCFYPNLTARQNLRLLASLTGPVSKARVNEVLEVVDLADRADDRVKIFSMGMKQRLGIAQALLPHPKLLILDEPTNGLDPQGVRDMRDLILTLNREWGLTIFLSSHILAEVERLCTRLAILDRGRCLFEGTLDDLGRRFPMAKLCVHTPDPAAAFHELQAAYPDVTLTADGVELAAGPECVPQVARRLLDAQVVVHAIAPVRRDLESLFLETVSADNAERADSASRR